MAGFDDDEIKAHLAALEEAGLHLSSVIVWDKGSMVLTRKDFHSQYELIFRPPPANAELSGLDRWFAGH